MQGVVPRRSAIKPGTYQQIGATLVTSIKPGTYSQLCEIDRTAGALPAFVCHNAAGCRLSSVSGNKSPPDGGLVISR